MGIIRLLVSTAQTHKTLGNLDLFGVVELGDVVRIVREPTSYTVFRRDGRFAEMVTAELAGAFEAPIYGMLAVDKAVEAGAPSPIATGIAAMKPAMTRAR